jgi:uncharacterized protein (TIGR00369 family)
MKENTADTLYFDDISIGDTHLTGGRTVTEADIVNFDGLSGDFQALHMDETYAAATQHGKRIAHGLLVIAMTSGLVARLALQQRLERAIVGLLGIECRFLKPVFIGDTITVSVEVIEKTEGRKPDRGTVALRRMVRNQHAEPISIAPGLVEASMPDQPKLLNVSGDMHGGMLMSGLDFVMSAAARSNYTEGLAVSTINMTTIEGARGPLKLTARCLRQGRFIAFCEAEAKDSAGRTVARCSGTFSVRAKTP